MDLGYPVSSLETISTALQRSRQPEVPGDNDPEPSPSLRFRSYQFPAALLVFYYHPEFLPIPTSLESECMSRRHVSAEMWSERFVLPP